MPLRIENAVDLHCHFGRDTIGGSLEFGDAFHGIPAMNRLARPGPTAMPPLS